MLGSFVRLFPRPDQSQPSILPLCDIYVSVFRTMLYAHTASSAWLAYLMCLLLAFWFCADGPHQATKASCANMDQKIGVEIIEKALRFVQHDVTYNLW